MRRLLLVSVGVVIVAAGLFGLLALFNDRDSGSLSTGTAASGPGVLEQRPGDPPTSGEPGAASLQREGEVDDPTLLRALSLGDIALVYGSAKPPPQLESLREDVIGPFDPELAAAGQMVFLVRRPGTNGIEALAWKRRLLVQSPQDPQLRQFVDAWLGQGRGNTE